MRLHRRVPALLAAVLVTATAAPARPAHAAHDGATSLGGQLLLLAAIGTTAAVGTATDVGLAISLGTTGHAPLVLSLGGTVLWLATSALYVTLLVVDSQFTGVTLNPGTVVASVFCGGSLALSVYGITRSPAGLSLVPAAFRGDHGALAPGLALTLRW